MSCYLFEHLDVLGQRIAQAPALVVFLHMNGSFAASSEMTRQGELSPSVRQTLRALARLEDVEVAIFSSRKLSGLKESFALPDLCYAGNDGLEICTPECTFVEPAALALQGALRDLAGELARKLQPVAGVAIEDNGLAMAVRCHEVAEGDLEAVRRGVHAALSSSSHPFVLTQGDKVYEIRPRVYWSKADAARWIKEQTGRQDALAIYVGDSASDEEAFAALADGVTLRVGSAPDSAAQYHVNEPHEVHEFLGWLANFQVDRLLAEPRPTCV